MDDGVFHEIPDRIGDLMPASFDKHRTAGTLEGDHALSRQRPGNHGLDDAAGNPR
jgi:hypothetical protein